MSHRQRFKDNGSTLRSPYNEKHDIPKTEQV